MQDIKCSVKTFIRPFIQLCWKTLLQICRKNYAQLKNGKPFYGLEMAKMILEIKILVFIL